MIQISAIGDDDPESPISACISARICAWIVTSSAVVGSSQTIRSGSFSSAIAIATRWRMPPDSWCGYAASRCSGDAMPTRVSALIARVCIASRDSGGVRGCATSVSIICVPIVSTGFSVIIGSWKIIAMRSPRRRRIASSSRVARSMPSNITLPSTTRPGGSISRRIDRPVTDLPEPDSPTRPSTSPAWTTRSTPSTALTMPALVVKWVFSPSTRRTGRFMPVATRCWLASRQRPEGVAHARRNPFRTPLPDPPLEGEGASRWSSSGCSS